MNNIINLYKKYGDSEYFGESVSKTTHMIQAAVSAEKNNEPDYLVLACLLHDIGHFLDTDNMNGLGVIEHGKVGADYLRNLGMNEKICCLIENHVLAKKYLVSKNQYYYDKLSDASKKTLEYQGGKMSNIEMELFEKDPYFQDSLKVRLYDDIGKEIGMEIPKLDSYYELIEKYLDTSYLKDKLAKNGYLLIKNYFNLEDTKKIISFKDKLEKIDEQKGKWMIYYEKKDNQKLKSRIENFINYNTDILDFLNTKINPFLNKVCGGDMIIFKDKINWKLSGGKGFKAHQDQPAWNDFNVSRFYSVALFGTNSTIENGCLQVVKEKNNIGLLNENGGCISSNIENQLKWKYLESTPSDLLIFDSFIPHRSDTNKSQLSRSIFYFTYNKKEEGNFYNQYVSNKRKYFPPENERDGSNLNTENNKYNLGNPII